MADVKIVQLADAVVADLAAEQFSQAFTPTRAYVPTIDLQEVKDLVVTVVANARSETPVSRADDEVDYTIDVGVQKKISGDVNTSGEVDALLALVLEVAAFLNRHRLTEAADMTWVGTKNDPIYYPEHLLNLRQFTSVLSVSYRQIE